MAKVVLPQIAESHLAKLKAHKEAHKENKLVSDATDAEIAVTEDKLAKYKEPEPAFESAKKALDTLLDEVDKALEKHGESKPEAPKFLCGDKFTLVDCVVVPLLARVQWAGPGREAVHARPRVEAYYHAASARKAFSEADVWTGIKPLSAAVVLSGVAIDSVVALADLAGKEWNEHVAPPLGAAWQKVSDSAKSAGDAINEHVIKPVSETPAVKAAQLAYDTQVLPRLRDAAKSTGDFLNDKVLTPVKDGADKAGHAFSEAAEKAKEAAKEVRACCACWDCVHHVTLTTSPPAHPRRMRPPSMQPKKQLTRRLRQHTMQQSGRSTWPAATSTTTRRTRRLKSTTRRRPATKKRTRRR